MLRHLHLLDPIERANNIKKFDFSKYIDMTRNQTRPTEQDIVEEIHDCFYTQHYSKVDTERLDKLWNFVSTKVKINAGLASFIIESGGVKSDFFFPWLYNVFRSPSMALEMAYGTGHNIQEEWTSDIPKTDPIDSFFRNDPAFLYNREKQLYLADLASTIQDYSYECYEHNSKVVDFGAGRMAWTRWHDFQFDPDVQEILAFDKDPAIKMEEIFGLDTAQLGLSFKHGNLEVQINNPISMGADLIILSGIAPYYRKDVFLNAILMPAYHLLNPGGVLFYDIYINSDSFMAAMKLFDWPTMHLVENLASAFDDAENSRMALWEQGLKFNTEYIVDGYNNSPIGLMVVLQKQ